ncbi:MAG: hypothetical protein J2P37_00920, partial [Ktedonobacteraceae bacterium]|nr:hypothetical protein [Ktedonobacteraceae bacterium]
ITGNLIFHASRSEGIVHIDDYEVEIEVNQEETLEFIRLLRSVPEMELESIPSLPIRSKISMHEVTLQIQSTFEFMGDMLLACNQARKQGSLRDIEMMLKLIQRLLIGYKVVYSEPQQSYVLVPLAQGKIKGVPKPGLCSRANPRFV